MPVDDHVRDVHAARAELAGKALGDHAQPCLGNGKGDVSRGAAQRGGRAREQERAPAALHHPMGCGLAHDEPGQAALPPGLLERVRRHLQHGAGEPGPDVEHYEFRRPHLGFQPLERPSHALGVGCVAGVAGRAAARDADDLQAVVPGGLDQRPAQLAGGSHDDGGRPGHPSTRSGGTGGVPITGGSSSERSASSRFAGAWTRNSRIPPS